MKLEINLKSIKDVETLFALLHKQETIDILTNEENSKTVVKKELICDNNIKPKINPIWTHLIMSNGG